MDRRTLASHLSQLAVGVMLAACVSFVTQTSAADPVHRDRQIRIEGIPQTSRPIAAIMQPKRLTSSKPIYQRTVQQCVPRPSLQSNERRASSLARSRKRGVLHRWYSKRLWRSR